MGVAFESIPYGNTIHPFPFSATGIGLSTYIYFHIDKLIWVMVGSLLVSDSKSSERWTNVVFLSVLVFDWIDYALTCNQMWFEVGFPVTGNLVKLLAFGILTRVWDVSEDGHRENTIFQK